MARLFTSASSEYLKASSAAVTTVPLTMAAWVYTDTPSITTGILSVSKEAGAADFQRWHMVVNTTCRAQAASDPSQNASQSANSVPANQWAHCCGVWIDNTQRKSAVDGLFGATTSTAITPTGVSRTLVGATVNNSQTLANFFSGSIAEAAIWNAALTDDEVAMLAAGYSPLCLTHRLGNLVMYQDLIRPLDRPGIGPAVTATGTTVSEHPQIIYPSRLHLGLPPITPKVGGPFCIETANVWTPTVVAGQEFFVGAQQGEPVSTGPTAGEVNC